MLRPNKKEIEHIFPFRIPEFMMSGNLVITSKVPPLKLYLEENHGVKFISSSNNSLELAKLIINLAENPLKRFQIGLDGRKYALKHFSFDTIGKRLSKFLKGLKYSD